MRVLFVTSKINFERAGGSVPDLDCKVREMQYYGADVRVLTVYSLMNQHPLTVPYPVEEAFVRSGSLLRIQNDVFHFLRTHGRNADVIHIEGQFAYAAAIYRLFGGKPVVAFFNREPTVWDAPQSIKQHLRRLCEKLLFFILVPRIDQIYFTTPKLFEWYKKFGLRIDQRRVSILLDLLDPKEMLAVTSSVKRSSSKMLRVLASGRMIKQKGFHILIEAVEQLPAKVRERIHVTIGGDGEEKERLLHMTKEKILEKYISFPGWLSKEDFWKQLAAHDIFVLPRWRIEQPSVIVMEALALGVPSIVPGNGAVEWMAGNAAATFVDNDSSSLSKTLERVIVSPEERHRLSENARIRWKILDYRPRSRVLWDILTQAAKLNS